MKLRGIAPTESCIPRATTPEARGFPRPRARLDSHRIARATMTTLLRYLAQLTAGLIILWCYALWWTVNVTQHFDPRPRLWLTSLGLSGIIGTALWISTRSSSRGTTQLDGWQIFWLFLMPFCVSSFAALVKDAGFILVFPPTARENVTGLALIAAFVIVVRVLKKSRFANDATARDQT